jgi:hypothetical protein
MPSTRIAEMYEVQVFEGGKWRAKSVHGTLEDAKSAVANIVVDRFVEEA